MPRLRDAILWQGGAAHPSKDRAIGDNKSGQNILSGREIHQGRGSGILRSRRAISVAAFSGSARDPEALSGWCVW